MIFQCIHQTQSSLTQLPDANTSCFLKNMHVISGLHPNNLVCGCDPLDPSKSDPSDPDCPGYPTHFQP